MYGETEFCARARLGAAGLSPRVRGNPLFLADPVHALRSIPACTGKPCGSDAVKSVPRVYPRVYGETMNGWHIPIVTSGLSPRVRGNHYHAVVMRVANGSIPACTGKPGSAKEFVCQYVVYPRVYGETPLPSWSTLISAGLSPRVRGNPRNQGIISYPSGSIPACTGKPGIQVFPVVVLRVYPRVYGETTPMPPCQAPPEGLSPRVRGNRMSRRRTVVLRGSIPACTGKPEISETTTGRAGVYPRVYGETSSFILSLRHPGGLSPRVRGNPACFPLTGCVPGSIPACTGKP